MRLNPVQSTITATDSAGEGEENELRASVAMCTFNGERFLRDQLESIALQVRQPYELVVYDDRSFDGTPEILRTFASTARFPVRLNFNEQNIGSTMNFEKAIAVCSGDVIVLADQDDVWLPEKLRRIEEVLSSTPRIGGVFSDAEVVDENQRDLGYRLWDAIGFDTRRQKRFEKGNAIEELLKSNVVTGATMAFRAEFRKYLLPIPESCVHDWWIALLISFVADLELIPEPLIRYRQHSGNQIGGKRVGFAGKFETALGIDSKVYLSVADSYQHAYKRVSGAGDSIHRDKLQLLGEKSNHFYARSRYPRRMWSRIPVAARELISMRYHRYSLGLKSFMKDLLFFH